MVDKKKVQFLIYELLKAIGEDPEREGLKETPLRVAKMYEEIFEGLSVSPYDHIKKFKEDNTNDEVILVKDIPIYSMCEHHLIPFFGTANVAYIPNKGEIIGLSKISRIVDCYVKRPQVQERLTNQVADFIFSECKVLGVAVFIEAQHLCMTMRGIKSMGSKTKTTAFRGIMSSDKEKKQEVVSLLQ